MYRRTCIAAGLTALGGLAAPGGRAGGTEGGQARPLVLAHVMPWFESKPVSGRWGWHWTMGRFDPEKVDARGRRSIASRFDPLIGPYDSADPDVLEYHALLMRVVGIDGAIADWYGPEDCHDYAAIHRRASALFEALKRRGLKFAVCYEDRALRALAGRDKLTPAQVVEHGRIHLGACDRDWFPDPAYATWGGRPLLLAFGPDYLDPAQWGAVLAGLKHPPTLLSLHERRPPAAGSFAWPPMWASKGGTLRPGDLDAYLDRFGRQDGPTLPAAFPGFHDIYAEAGVRPSYGYLDARGGATFRETLGRAWASGAPVIQVATWNDFGEGTCVEPTREYGYRYLEMIQEARRRSPGPPFPYEADALRLPLRVHGLRRRLAPSSPDRRGLDEATDALHAADVPRAIRQIEALEGRSPPR